MNLKNNVSVLSLISVIVIAGVSCSLLFLKLGKQVQVNELLRTEIGEIKIIEKDYIENSARISEVINGYQQNKAEIGEKFSSCKFPVLIYRYSQNMCDMCIREDFIQLHKQQEIIGKDHIYILPSFEEARNNVIRLKNELASFHYGNLFGKLCIPGDEDRESHRYFALIDEAGNMELVFFPNLDTPEITEQFFSTVRKRLGLNE